MDFKLFNFILVFINLWNIYFLSKNVNTGFVLNEQVKNYSKKCLFFCFLSFFRASSRTRYIPNWLPVNSVLFSFGQILSCGLNGKWTTGWTGARLSLVSIAWVQTWEACTAVSCVAWTEKPSWVWCLTAPQERFSGSIWRIWGEVHVRVNQNSFFQTYSFTWNV